MTDSEKLEAIRKACGNYKPLSDDAVQSCMEGGQGQYDDTFDAGERHGLGLLADDIRAILDGGA